MRKLAPGDYLDIALSLAIYAAVGGLTVIPWVIGVLWMMGVIG